MLWVLVGVLSGSLVTSTFDSREACEGRAVILREQKVVAKCVELPKNISIFTTGTIFMCALPDGTVTSCGK